MNTPETTTIQKDATGLGDVVNAETQAAIEDSIAGRTEKFDSVADMVADAEEDSAKARG